MQADTLRLITDVCARAAAGDFEARLPSIGDAPEAEEARHALNRLLDKTDSFVREAGAALGAAAEGRFHRRFLPRGMQGAYRDAADRISQSTDEMSRSTAHRGGAGRRRRPRLRRGGR